MYCTKEEFNHYIYSQMESIKTAIRKKANGSTVEDLYFLEHWEKIKTFFLESKIKEE